MEYKNLIERLDRIERLLTLNKEVLTFDEVRIYTGMSSSYLYKLTSKGIIPCSKPNGKLLFFKKSHIDNWLLRNNLKSSEELSQEALRFTVRNKAMK